MGGGGPSGTLAYRQYTLSMLNGRPAKIAISLGDITSEGEAARFAREAGASAFGHALVVDHPDAPELPYIWMQTDTGIAAVAVGRDSRPTPELKALIEAGLEAFWRDLEGTEPAP